MGLDLGYFSKQSKKAVSEFKPRYHPCSVPFTVLHAGSWAGVSSWGFHLWVSWVSPD